MLTINTTRFSAVVGALLDAYPGAVVVIDRTTQSGAPFDWCTNARLTAANNFSLLSNGVEYLGFHDGPRNMWASDSALRLVERLSTEKALRFTQSAPRPARLIERLFGWRKSANKRLERP